MSFAELVQAAGAAVPSGRVVADRPPQQLRLGRRILTGVDDGDCVQAVVEACSQLVEELGEYEA
jgi:hypothetical protein